MNAAVLKTVDGASCPGVRIPPSPQVFLREIIMSNSKYNSGNKYFTYILISLNGNHSSGKNRYYFGHTKNLEERLKTHNAGKVRSTKAFHPWEIHYFEEFSSRKEAFAREMYFNSLYKTRYFLCKS